jgi:hypothetical protein
MGTGWVLRSCGLTELIVLKNVEVEEEASVPEALALNARGVEFADAIHLTSRPPGATFV